MESTVNLDTENCKIESDSPGEYFINDDNVDQKWLTLSSLYLISFLIYNFRSFNTNIPRALALNA